MTVSTRSQSKQSLFTSYNSNPIVTRSRSSNMMQFSQHEIEAANALIQLKFSNYTTKHPYFTRLSSSRR